METSNGLSKNLSMEDTLLIAKNNDCISVDVTGKNFYETGDKASGTIYVIRDLTDFKNSQQVLMQSSKLTALGQMAGGIAHEINNPLAIIGVANQNIEFIAEQGGHAQLSKLTKTIDDTIKRISKIIVGMKTLSRESNSEMIPTTLNRILAVALGVCGEKFKHNQIKFEVEDEEGILDRTILCDKVQISQVILNLLSNAFDEVHAKEERWIKVLTEMSEDFFRLKVIDSGSGIPADQVQQIFNPFFTTKPVGCGTGLGLSISKGILEKHGGSLEVDQNFPNTCFVISLPVQ